MSKPLVKICGIRSARDAIHALDSGADLIGIILVPDRKRTVNILTATEISAATHSHPRYKGITAERLRAIQKTPTLRTKSRLLLDELAEGPLLVGVFQNQSLEVIRHCIETINLDLVQLHGNEDKGMAAHIPVPVIRRFTPGDVRFDEWSLPGQHAMVLLDSTQGGTGESLDWNSLGEIQKDHEFILAGGLNPDNVAQATKSRGVIAVDVSGGVEQADGLKCPDKVSRFIKNAKATVSGI